MSKPTISRKILAAMETPSYWLDLNPDLTITERPFLVPIAEPRHAVDTDRVVRQMHEEGYFKVDEMLQQEDVEKLADAIIRLVENDIPPVFVAVYDEFWQLFRNLAPIAEPIFGKNYWLSTNFWAWYVPASSDDAGFAPHRDITGSPAMREDGLPWLATVWIPLKDVTTLNACMYVLPTNLDPNVPDNLHVAEIPPEAVQNIRALPAKAGSVLSWNPNALHWGSRSSQWADGPRISIAAYLRNKDGPNFTSIALDATAPLTLGFRLGAIGIDMDHYDKDAIDKARYPAELLELCNHYYHCERNENRAPLFSDEKIAKRTAKKSKPSRNEPCPCGSGKKYKRCCGATD